MKSNLSFLVIRMLPVVLGLAFGTGCATTKPGPAFSYVIRLDAVGALKDQKFTVDVVPVNSANLPTIRAMSVDDYFNGKDNFRQGLLKIDSKVLSSTQPEFRVDLAAPAFKDYRYPAYSHIAIIADSSVRANIAGLEQRRLLLPLDPKQWPPVWSGKKYEITVRFSETGVDPSPAPLGVP